MRIYSSDYSNNDFYLERLNHLNSPLIGPSAFAVDDDARKQLSRRAVLALLPAKSTNLLRLLTGRYDENRIERRAGNYIRFGKKKYPQQTKRMGNMVRSYMDSFGTRDKKPDGVFMRFGRSLPDRDTDVTPSENEAADANETTNVGNSLKKLNWKRFMRFGRIPKAAEKQKRFMRFGRAHENDGSAVDDADEPSNAGFSRINRNFMRFGRSHINAATDSKTSLSIHEARQQKRFMRFGRDLKRKRLSMPNPDSEPKQRSIVPEDEAVGADHEHTSGQAKPAKRFMRFGKRPNDEANSDTSPIAAYKRFMRFGKRTRNIDGISPKRFMRFGKRPYSSQVMKRFLRVVKKPSIGAMK